MIDTEKMKALAAELRANHEAMKSWMPTHQLESSPASKGADAIDTLLAALEAAAADKRDAERYRLLRRGQKWSVVNGIGETLRAEQLDDAIDAQLSQRQEEGS
ncbi:hypothetical protein KTE49_14105 [Burkholderia multivorans]|uniref:hypothetical protein n=1 Tax=Burkholderia multivorans TaxID=87883 RepID=UPI001588DBFC|nr:hypothetical protein [Burkholderia multivorans]MBU9531571.1 hypothetical protein [Burkholderia multivorans]MDR8786339.1 hypothetical protein [Burkholderia multivorans]MDR8828027.1 hypothetical protein [Burkholderia multivorans]